MSRKDSVTYLMGLFSHLPGEWMWGLRNLLVWRVQDAINIGERVKVTKGGNSSLRTGSKEQTGGSAAQVAGERKEAENPEKRWSLTSSQATHEADDTH